ncbi:geranylgeranylglycerol-phosphate geranylgeranyltransferase [Empedobacter sedimenti]|uniref:geranylgeranylglycerol-phosphate geranylgeranyltransferase n=1 Tax=Empedobacter sedimenti TaxID=3042610 RepID=UPI0024A7984A|nr:geranylgeranylglycerol-phosphate geranylgeranyltransferase [Empedobacter sedimenti]
MNVQKIILKIIALFSVVRGYNLVVLILAQYLAALFIFAPEVGHRQLLTNPRLDGIILCSILCVAAGYIINNFYDLEKDELKRPLQVYLQKQVSQGFKLTVYIFLNAIALIIAGLISWKVFIFFLIYQFLVWFYSHKINRFALIKNFYLVIIRVMPFFALLVYFDNFTFNLALHAIFVTILFLITDIVKDLTSQKADIIYNYDSIPIKYGIDFTKVLIASLLFIDIIIGFVIIYRNDVGAMKYFFIGAVFCFIIIFLMIWKLKTTQEYKILHYFFKGMIVAGVFSIVLIEINPLTLQTIAQNFNKRVN